MISYTDSCTNVTPAQLHGFFANWPNAPTPETLLRILNGSDYIMIDLICDPELQPFYARLGLRPYTGMIRRNYERQRCD
jgi:hypothetical protein